MSDKAIDFTKFKSTTPIEHTSRVEVQIICLTFPVIWYNIQVPVYSLG